MSKIPLDVKALIEEALNVSEAANEPLSVSVYLDDTAPQDVVAHVRNVFASAAVHVRITLSYLGPSQAPVSPTDDLAVVVAGLGQSVGAFAEEARSKGVPAMIVTTLPTLVAEIAREQGHPIPDGDIISPLEAPASSAPLMEALSGLAAKGETEPAPASEPAPVEEPIVLTAPNIAVLNERMGGWVIEACRDKRLSMALAFPFVRKPLALESVNMTSVQNAGFGAVIFIPGADMPVMTMNQAKMLLQIAAAYGQPMNAERVKELCALVAGAFAFRTVAREVADFVPIIGWAVKGVVAYAGTLAMGRAAIEYFEAGGGPAGLAHVVGKARDAAVAASATAAAPEAAEPEPEKTIQETVAEAAQVWGKRANKVAGIAGKTAGPLMGAMAKAGIESFAAGAASLASSVSKK